MAQDLDARIKALIEKEATLEKRKIELTAELKIREQELSDLRDKLKEEHGVDSYDELKNKLSELKGQIEDIVGFDAE